MKKIIFVFFLITIFFGILSCKKESKSDKIRIITTIFPLYDFAKQVGKDKIEVSMLLPPGAEAHSFEPTPQDIVKINESSIFIYISEYMEPWASKILKTIKKDIIIIEAGKDIEMLEHDEDEHDEHGDEEQHKDPHIWLDFEIDQKIVLKIAEELGKIDPLNREFYFDNAKNYNSQLEDLDKRYRETIKKCELKTIMYGGHFAFGYLAKRYGLTHISPYKGFTPNSEPAPQNISELIDTIKKNKIEYLFYEELLDPKVAKAIASATGVKLELLHAAHNLSKQELEQNITFLQIMEDNLVKFKKALRYKE